MRKQSESVFIKKIIGIFLVVVIMVCSIELVFNGNAQEIIVEAAGKTVKADPAFLKDTISYTAFGDSIAAGYGLMGYQAGVLHSAPDAYREQVADGLAMQYPDTQIFTDSLAIDGLNSTQLRSYLTDPENMEYETFRKAAETSDVITLSIGSNDILGPFLEAGAQELGCSVGEISSTLQERLTSGSFMELFSLLETTERMNKALAGLPQEMDAEMAEKTIAEHSMEGNEEFNQACAQFAENLQVILKTLHELSPEAEIFVTNIYNPYKGISLINPLTSVRIFDIGNLAEFYIQKLNQAFTEDTELYHLIDVKTAFDSAEMVPVNADIPENFGMDITLEQYNLDPHPSAEGHAIIASLIKEAMADIPVLARKLLPEKGTELWAGNFCCKVTVSDGRNGEVMITGIKKAGKKIVIPDLVILGPYQLKVTSIGKKTWKGDKKITSLIIGKNIREIRKEAFYKCRNLKKVKVESKEIIKVGARAFKKLHKELSFQFPKRYKKKYKKMF